VPHFWVMEWGEHIYGISTLLSNYSDRQFSGHTIKGDLIWCQVSSILLLLCSQGQCT